MLIPTGVKKVKKVRPDTIARIGLARCEWSEAEWQDYLKGCLSASRNGTHALEGGSLQAQSVGLVDAEHEVHILHSLANGSF